MRMATRREILVVHAADSAWHDLVNELDTLQTGVETAHSLGQAEHRLRERPPDVILLDGHFEHGIDLLLQARHTTAGTVVIVVRRHDGQQVYYDAILPGEPPRYVEPTDPRSLARTLREAMLARPALPTTGSPG